MLKRESKLKLQFDKIYKFEKNDKSQNYLLLSNKYKNIKLNSFTANINTGKNNRVKSKKNIVRTTSAFLKRNYNNYLLKIAERNTSINSSMIKEHQLNEMLYKLKKYDNELNTYNMHKLEKINELKKTMKQNELKLKKLYDLQDIN